MRQRPEVKGHLRRNATMTEERNKTNNSNKIKNIIRKCGVFYLCYNLIMKRLGK